MPKHHRVVRQQAKCSCGMRSHDETKMREHLQGNRGRGHTLLRMARVSRQKGD